MKLLCTCVFILLVTIFLLAGVALSQSGQGSVEGTITDTSGAVVPGVNIKLTNAGTGLSFTTASNESGYFRFPVVPVGTYDLTAESKAFAAFAQRGFPVNVGSAVNLPISLNVAGQKEAVEVTGELPVVETTRSSLSNTVTQRSV